MILRTLSHLLYALEVFLLINIDSFAADDWCQWGGDRCFNAPMRLDSVEVDVIPELTWSTPMEIGNSGIAIRGNSAVTMGRQGEREYVRGIDLMTGANLWSFDYEARLPEFFDLEFNAGPHATPALGVRTGCTIGVSGIIHFFDLQSGDIVWSRNLWSEYPATRLERGFASSPLFINDVVVIALGGSGCSLLALDVRNGKTVWSKNDFDSAYCSPILADIDGHRQIVALMAKNLIGLDPEKGDLLWSLDFVSENTVHVASPIVTSKGQIFCGSSEKCLLGQPERSENGWQFRTDWTSRKMRPQLGNVIEVGGLLVGPSSGSTGILTSVLELKTGFPKMRERLGGLGFYYRCEDGFVSINERGDLSFASVVNGELNLIKTYLNWIDPLAWSPAALGAYWIVVRNRDKIQRYNLRSK
jgi:outer membrane protein assembly factor BamB